MIDSRAPPYYTGHTIVEFAGYDPAANPFGTEFFNPNPMGGTTSFPLVVRDSLYETKADKLKGTGVPGQGHRQGPGSRQRWWEAHVGASRCGIGAPIL